MDELKSPRSGHSYRKPTHCQLVSQRDAVRQEAKVASTVERVYRHAQTTKR